MNMIEVKDVSICFRMANDKLNSLKELMIQKVKGKHNFGFVKAATVLTTEIP